MGNWVTVAEKEFWNCSLDVTTGGVKYRAFMFIKTVLEAVFGFPNIFQITKAALYHVDNIKSITSNVRFDFVGFTSRVESVIITAVVNIGVSGGSGVVTIICLWQLDFNKNIA